MKKLFIGFIVICCCAMYAQTPALAWAKSFNGPDDKVGRDIAVNAQGLVLTVGQFRDSVDFDPGPGKHFLHANGDNHDMYISKLTAAGVLVWAKSCGGYYNEVPLSLTLDNNGDIIIAGFFMDTVDFDPGSGVALLSANDIAYDIFILKLDQSGNFLGAYKMGGPGGDWAYDVATDASSNIITVGVFEQTCDMDPGILNYQFAAPGQADNAYVSKLDGQGNFVWARHLLSVGSVSAMSALRSVAIDQQGNVYCSGYFKGTCDFDPGPGNYTVQAVNSTAFVLKLSPSGNFRWVRTIAAANGIMPNAITTDAGDNVIVTGSYSGAADLDPGPGTQTANLGGAFVLKMDSMGATKWVAFNDGAAALANYSNPLDIVTDGQQDIYLAGYFDGTVDLNFDPASTNTVTSAGKTDVFILKLTAGGHFECAGQMGGAGNDLAYGIAYDPMHFIYTTGAYGQHLTGGSDFDPGPGSALLYSDALVPGDVFISKLSNCQDIYTGTAVNEQVSALTAYPNPVEDLLTLKCRELMFDVRICTATGSVVSTIDQEGETITLDLHALSRGIYFVNARTAAGELHIKIVKD